MAKIITNNKAITMILDHDYLDNGNVCYLAQRYDGFQKWIRNPDKVQWKTLLDEYWENQQSSQYDSPEFPNEA